MASGGIAGWRELDPPRFRSTGDPDRSPRPARRPLRNPVPGAGFALSSSNARERPLTARRPAPIDVETSSDSRVWHTGSGPRGRAARPSIGGADSRTTPAVGTVTADTSLSASPRSAVPDRHDFRDGCRDDGRDALSVPSPRPAGHRGWRGPEHRRERGRARGRGLGRRTR